MQFNIFLFSNLFIPILFLILRKFLPKIKWLFKLISKFSINLKISKNSIILIIFIFFYIFLIFLNIYFLNLYAFITNFQIWHLAVPIIYIFLALLIFLLIRIFDLKKVFIKSFYYKKDFYFLEKIQGLKINDLIKSFYQAIIFTLFYSLNVNIFINFLNLNLILSTLISSFVYSLYFLIEIIFFKKTLKKLYLSLIYINVIFGYSLLISTQSNVFILFIGVFLSKILIKYLTKIEYTFENIKLHF